MCEVCRSSLWCLLSFALVSRLAIHYHPFPSLPANFLSDLDVYNLHWPARYTPPKTTDGGVSGAGVLGGGVAATDMDMDPPGRSPP